MLGVMLWRASTDARNIRGKLTPMTGMAAMSVSTRRRRAGDTASFALAYCDAAKYWRRLASCRRCRLPPTRRPPTYDGTERLRYVAALSFSTVWRVTRLDAPPAAVDASLDAMFISLMPLIAFIGHCSGFTGRKLLPSRANCADIRARRHNVPTKIRLYRRNHESSSLLNSSSSLLTDAFRCRRTVPMIAEDTQASRWRDYAGHSAE